METIRRTNRALALLTVPVAVFAVMRVGLDNGFAPAVLVGAGALFLVAQSAGIPALFGLVFSASMLFHGIAWAGDLYESGPWDLLSHALTTAAVALAISVLALRPLAASMRGAFVIACIGMAAGAGWEVLEWSWGLEDMTLDDTITDLIADGVGAALAATLFALTPRAR